MLAATLISSGPGCDGGPDSSSSGSAPPWRHRRGSAPELPPGFRFHPTDEELVVHYLKKKAAKVPLPVTIITEVDLYKFDPWELPGKASFGEQEWYFFSPRQRKYPNGARPNRATTSGYWKATGTDKPILKLSAVKKALVFYHGKPHKGLKTNWMMHEYRLTDSSRPSSTTTTSLRLDDWVLCRIYKKINKAAAAGDQQRSSMELMDCVEDAVVATAGMAPCGSDYTSLLHHHDSHEADNYFLDGLLKAAAAPARVKVNPAAASNQLLAPSSSTSNPFNWSTVGILPQARNFPASSRNGNVWRSSTADDMTCAVDNGGGNAVNAMTAFMNIPPLPVQDALQQHVILASSGLPPEQATAAATSAFQQHPVQTFAGSWWNP